MNAFGSIDKVYTLNLANPEPVSINQHAERYIVSNIKIDPKMGYLFINIVRIVAIPRLAKY
jgi:hypothetical protein